MMKTTFRSCGVAVMFGLLALPAEADAREAPQSQQQQGRPQTPADRRSGAQAAGDDCMAAQSKVSVTATTARDRLDAARQTNEPAQLRAAVDEALLALGALLAATEPCRVAPPTIAMAGMDHATMTAPQTGTPVSARPPVAADPHAGHVMPPAATVPSKPATPAGKPQAKPDPHAGMKMPPAATPAAKPPAKPGAAKPADPHAAHGGATPKPTPFATDPKNLVCAQTIDPETAPSTTYKGKTYYFCSAADRLRFIKNPETVLKGGGGR